MNTVSIPRQIVNQILSHAINSPDDEICGLISKTAAHNTRCYRIPNVASNTHDRYEMDAKSLIDAMRTMREQGETLFAIYHSHPHSDALPSIIDIREANYRDALYLIVSLNTKGILDMRGYRLGDDLSEEVRLEME